MQRIRGARSKRGIEVSPLALLLLSGALVLSVGLDCATAADDTLLVESEPPGAAVYDQQRGSLTFYGYTPLAIEHRDLLGNRLVVSQVGFVRRTVKVDTGERVTVSLETDRKFSQPPQSLRRNCSEADLKSYDDLIGSLRGVATKHFLETPIEFAEVHGKKALFVVTTVRDRKTRAKLRSIRRKDGVNAFEEALAGEVESIALQALANAKRMHCADYLSLRAVYSDGKLDFDFKRIEVPWTQTLISQQGKYTVYTTKSGTSGENVSTIRLSDNADRFVDYFYSLK